MGSIRNENHDLSCIDHDHISIDECNPAHEFDQFPLLSRIIRDEDVPSRRTYQRNSIDRLTCLIRRKTLKAAVCIVFIICVVCLITMAILLTQRKQYYSKNYDDVLKNNRESGHHFVFPGESIVLDCAVDSCGANFVFWYKYENGHVRNITSETDSNKYSGSTPSIPNLTIFNADKTDAGSYTCFVVIENGTVHSNITKLYVSDGSVGDEFIVAFVNSRGMNANALYVTSRNHGKCFISSQNTHSSILVSPNTTSIYKFAKSEDLRDGKSRKGVYILCNTKVSITAYSKLRNKRAGFLLLPLQMLGKEYVVPSYMSTSNRYGHSSMFAVVAVYSDTLVNIKIRSSTKGNVNFDNKRYFNGSKIFINMTYLDTVQISEYKGDLSGTYINASKPVAVISGHTCVFMRNSYCGGLMEMIIAIKDFSKRFVIPQLERSERVKLRAYSYVKTDMFCSYLNKSNISFSLNPKDYLELDYEDLTTVRTTEKIHIQLYRRLFGGSSMTTVPGINQYLSYYMFFVPYGYQHNYLSIIIRSDGMKGIRIDKKEIETLQNRTFGLISTQYTTFVCRILSGRHIAEQIQNVPFGLFVFAENPQMSHDVNFVYIAGMSLLSFNGTE